MDLSRPWTTYPIAVLDCETTGVSDDDRVVEIAVVRFEPGGIVSDELVRRVNPGIPIPDEATAIHGICDADVVNCQRLDELVDDIALIAQGALPCAYNAGFDRSKIHAAITNADVPMLDPHFAGYLDPLVIARRRDTAPFGAGNYKLGSVCKRWGVAFDGEAHSARSDAMATGKLLFSMLDKGAVKPVSAALILSFTERCRDEDQARYEAWVSSRKPTSRRC